MKKKIFTFAAELLARIEEIEASHARNPQTGFLSRGIAYLQARWTKQQPQNPVTPFSAKITAYIEALLPMENPSWDDYQHFINALKQEINASRTLSKHLKSTMLVQCARQDTLIALQPKLPKPLIVQTPKQKAKQAALNVMRAGLVTPQLFAIAKKARSKKIPFQLFPNVPEQTKTIDANGIVNALNMINPEHREAAQWLFNHIHVLTLKELIASLREGFATFKEKNGKAPYTIVITPSKSQSWTPQLALRYLTPDDLPTKFFTYMGENDSVEIPNMITKTRHKNFVYCDDATYSGAQLCSFLSSVNRQAPKPKNAEDKIRIYAIMGFMSEKSKKFVENGIELFKKERPDVEITLICHRTFKDISTLCIDEKVSNELQQKIFSLVVGLQIRNDRALEEWRNKKHITTVTTQWKKPDNRSVTNVIRQGVHANSPKPYYSDPRVHSEPLIEVPVPYKKLRSK
jgi:hypothetical protein